VISRDELYEFSPIIAPKDQREHKNKPHRFLQEATEATEGGTGVSPGHRAIEPAFVMDFIFYLKLP
jgi:hypothetical protein